jgi:hypothetical protein
MDRKTAKSGQSGVAAVDRAIAILQSIAARQKPSSLSDIARETGFYKSTILRLLQSLEAADLVVRNSDNQYLLGSSVFRLGLAYERAIRLAKSFGLFSSNSSIKEPRARRCTFATMPRRASVPESRLEPFDIGSRSGWRRLSTRPRSGGTGAGRI